jgi:hypothetical protein
MSESQRLWIVILTLLTLLTIVAIAYGLIPVR